jgi:hypothetical protein
MYAKSLIAGLLGTALLATAAVAQSPSASDSSSTMSKSGMSNSASHSGQWRASKIVGLNVYNQSNEKLGDIDELLVDSSGKIQAVVIGVGGFLGVGTRDVAVAFDKLRWVDQPVSSNTAMNKTGTTPSGSSTSTATPSTTTGSATTSTASTSTADRMYPDHAVFEATRDQLKSMPEFTYGNK